VLRTNGFLDASAILALVLNDPGTERVAEVVYGTTVSTVNLSEVIARLSDFGLSADEILVAAESLDMVVLDFTAESAGKQGYSAKQRVKPACLWATAPASPSRGSYDCPP
jgi:PIN domain nuclease of toxin-antitoxin system